MPTDGELKGEIGKLIGALGIGPALDPFSRVDIPQEAMDTLLPLLSAIGERETRLHDVMGDFESYMRLAVLCVHAGKYDSALRYAEKALKMRERSTDAILVQAMANFRAGDYKKAVGYLDAILEIDPKHWVSWFYKGEALRARRLLERAVDAYTKALHIEKGRSEPWISLGHTLTDLNRVDEAAKAYAAGMKSGGEDGRGGKIRELLQEAKEKRLPGLFERVLKLAPDSVDAQMALAAIYRANGDYRAAMSHYDAVLKAQPANAAARKARDECAALWKRQTACKKCATTGKCGKCEGDGQCTDCRGGGKCPVCKGSRDCHECEGTGKCHRCLGKGKIRWFKRCPVCDGGGKCLECGGKARCAKCSGSGKCLHCDGGKKCAYCGGSGDCPDCGGKGHRELVRR